MMFEVEFEAEDGNSGGVVTVDADSVAEAKMIVRAAHGPNTVIKDVR